MDAIKEIYDTTQDVIGFLQQLLRGEAMQFSSVHVVKIKGVE
jgi:hypothetical protein